MTSPSPDEKTTDGLLACPHCGGDAMPWSGDWDDNSPDYTKREYFVNCGTCHAQTDRHPSEAQAVAAWNRRTPALSLTASLERVKELEKEVAFLNKTYVHPDPSVPNPCVYCNFYIYGSFVGAGDGTMKDGGKFAHPECFAREQTRIETAHLESRVAALTHARAEAKAEAFEEAAKAVCHNCKGGIRLEGNYHVFDGGIVQKEYCHAVPIRSLKSEGGSQSDNP